MTGVRASRPRAAVRESRRVLRHASDDFARRPVGEPRRRQALDPRVERPAGVVDRAESHDVDPVEDREGGGRTAGVAREDQDREKRNSVRVAGLNPCDDLAHQQRPGERHYRAEGDRAQDERDQPLVVPERRERLQPENGAGRCAPRRSGIRSPGEEMDMTLRERGFEARARILGDRVHSRGDGRVTPRGGPERGSLWTSQGRRQ